MGAGSVPSVGVPAAPWLLVAGVLLAGPADAASFDCAHANRADEVAICRNPDLSALDGQMGGLWFAYDRLPFLMGMSGVRQDEARAFLERRAACADLVCLRKLYAARIATLEVGLTSGIAQLATEQPSGGTPVPPALPPPVQATLEGNAGQCRQLGGSLQDSADRPNVLTGDFDGDGLTDYLLDTQRLRCSGSATAFCGNGGCQVDIAVSSAGFQPVSALGGQPTVTQGQDVAEVALWVSGANCDGLEDGQACWLTFAWKDGTASERHEAKPRPE